MFQGPSLDFGCSVGVCKGNGRSCEQFLEFFEQDGEPTAGGWIRDIVFMTSRRSLDMEECWGATGGAPRPGRLHAIYEPS